jgi:CheY-like chemotaxis protein
VRILIVEDDRLSQLILRTALQKLGHEVVACADGQEALDTLERDPFQLVISDWMMPRLSGVELCRAVRAREALPPAAGRVHTGYTYLILLTALDGKADYIQGMEAGADDLLTKPLDPEQLSARLRVADRMIGVMREMRQLEGLLPICSYCKKIREGDASQSPQWVPIESYVSSRTEASFSHGVCPTCYSEKLKPQLDELRQQRTKKD